ncbi:MAG: hypothetical protein R2828_01355 [Saprospiraceae bacterium]
MMERLTFNCTLLTDLVLSARAATEGFNLSLDYIPGVKFLGLVASQHYKLEKSQQTLDLFHNGKVRFGDAHPLIKGERALRVPAAWAYPKIGGLTESLYLYHNLTDDFVKTLTQQGIQLKQARGHYFTEGGCLGKVEQNFSIKSAYDGEKYRAKDSQMFGYFALKRGSKWQFHVDIDVIAYKDLLIKALSGQRRIGRSTSAEYGLVDIQHVPSPKQSTRSIPAGRVYLYAMSNLAFVDDFGNSILEPTPKQLLLPADSYIVWEHSQIRSRLYQTWNKKRSNRNADRQIIEKGSVIAVELSKEIESNLFQHGVGAYRSEGFGEILVNPSFLISKTEQVKGLKLKKNEEREQVMPLAPKQSKGTKDDLLLGFLAKKMGQEDRMWRTDQIVNAFIANNKEVFSGVTASQWGQVRNIAKKANNLSVLKKLLFDEKIGFFKYGQSEKTWRKKGRAILIEKFIFPTENSQLDNGLTFIIKLASEMAKGTKQKD